MFKKITLVILLILDCTNPAISQERNHSNQVRERFLLAQKLMGRGNYVQAIADFKEIIQDTPDFGKAYEWLVMASAYGQQLGQARQYFVSMTKQDSLNPYAYFGIGRVNQEKGNAQQALLSYKKAIELGCSYAGLYLNTTR
ncbi:hypothetical protein D6779_03900, partial [Candidatus Parcubacteria bacterium]